MKMQLFGSCENTLLAIFIRVATNNQKETVDEVGKRKQLIEK